MKRIVLLVIIITFLFACQTTAHHADKLCDCYTHLHRAKSDQEIEFWGDSCNQLHIYILKSLEDSIPQQQTFIKAYRNCQ